MSRSKLNIPEELLAKAVAQNNNNTDISKIEILKNERAVLEANSKVEIAKLQVAKEAMGVVKGLFDVMKSNNQLKSTVAEWQGRITQAELDIRKAELDLHVARENNHVRSEEIALSRDTLNRLLLIFDSTMEELNHVESQELKAELRSYLLELSDKLVQLRK